MVSVHFRPVLVKDVEYGICRCISVAPYAQALSAVAHAGTLSLWMQTREVNIESALVNLSLQWRLQLGFQTQARQASYERMFVPFCQLLYAPSSESSMKRRQSDKEWLPGSERDLHFHVSETEASLLELDAREFPRFDRAILGTS